MALNLCVDLQLGNLKYTSTKCEAFVKFLYYF